MQGQTIVAILAAMHIAIRTLFVTCLLAGLAGCGLFTPPVRVPMDVLRPDAGPCEGRAPALLVMLPGAYSRPSEFVAEDFVGSVRRRGLAADIVIADAHLGYFKDRSILKRLRDDIVLPARAAGYQKIWLVGISLGGFGALGYGARRGDDIDGVVAFAPYLGRTALLDEINAAGGPLAWHAAPHLQEDDNLERDMWEWLTEPPAERLPVYLGNGREDRMVDSHHMLAAVLPADRSDEVPGDHDWPAWRELWGHWLDRGLLPARCGAGS